MTAEGRQSRLFSRLAAKIVFLLLAGLLCYGTARYFSWLADTRPALMRAVVYGIIIAGWAGLEAEAVLGQRRRLKIGFLKGIDQMDGRDFEFWCAAYLKERGFTDVEVTRGSNDYGVDILASAGDISYAIQCKRCAYPVGNKAVQEVYTGMRMYECEKAAVLTNSVFTEAARQTAEQTGVLLWDRKWLEQHALQRRFRR